MAPHAHGQHERIQSEQTGYSWPVGPQFMITGTQDPTPTQAGLSVHDPMTGEVILPMNAARGRGPHPGLQAIYSIYDPRRFGRGLQGPHEPQQNYISCLVGLPGEMVVRWWTATFLVRRPPMESRHDPGQDAWSSPGWQVQRKDERQQRAVW